MIRRIINKLNRIYKLKILHQDPMELKIDSWRKLGVKIGKNCKLYSCPVTTEPYLVEIGDNVTISGDVLFINHDNSVIKVIEGATDIFGKITIGNNCFVGIRTLILPGVELADNIIVGGGSVVTKSFLEKGVIIAGNPAKVICSIDLFNEKYHTSTFNIDGLTFNEKRELIMKNANKLISK